MGMRSNWMLLLAPLVVACGADGEPQEAHELPYMVDAPADAATANDAAAAHDAGTGAARRDSGAWVPVGNDPLTADSACAAASVIAEQVAVNETITETKVTEVEVPVTLFVMFDKSASMSIGQLWMPAVTAMKDFVRAPSSSELDVAIQYFPNGGSCNGSGYSTPAVAPGTLPAHANAIVGSLDAQNASGLGTPIEGALRGVTQYCKSFQATHPGEKCVGVLVTDGRPELDGCEKDSTKLAAIAADAWNTGKVRTFAVGLNGADFGLLDMIAQAGGATDCDTTKPRYACDVSSGANLLKNALLSIRETVQEITTETKTETKLVKKPLACTWSVPAPAEGETLDPSRVNVTVTSGAGSLELGRVPSASECQAGGWYFDSATAPARIIACDETCAGIEASGATDVQILLGCETKVLVVI